MTDVPLFDIPSRPVDEDRRAILELIAGDPLHAGDREEIVRAIMAVAHANAGTVDMNEVRAHLTHPVGLGLAEAVRVTAGWSRRRLLDTALTLAYLNRRDRP